jgi:NAD(P)-dependent dehydrogenase (short-subunit alcohol dehydrogenase family)
MVICAMQHAGSFARRSRKFMQTDAGGEDSPGWCGRMSKPLDHFRLDNRIVLVTGASSGLGRHFAMLLASVGARVAVAARRADKLTDLVAQIEAAGQARALSLDVTQAASVRACLNREFLNSEAGQKLRARIPSRRFGELSDLNGPLLLLASEAGAAMSGATLAVDGAHRVGSP